MAQKVHSSPEAENDQWYNAILSSIAERFWESGTLLYGTEHSKDVDELVLLSLQRMGLSDMPDHERNCVRAAALLHDAGFALRNDNWMPDGLEHVQKGMELAQEILSGISYFNDNPRLIKRVVSLIQHHDVTRYSFPSASYQGSPPIVSTGVQVEATDPLLRVLREADALVHLRVDVLKESMEEWLSAGIPRATTDGGAISGWMWMSSVIGNIRLTAKRAIVDSTSVEGTQLALKGYAEAEQLVQHQCSLADASYEPEVCCPSPRFDSQRNLSNKKCNLEIVRLFSWDMLEQTLRAAPLQGDKSMRPYKNARLSSCVLPIAALTPMSLYVNQTRLSEVLELRDAFMNTFCLELSDLPGLLEYKYNSDKIQRLAPPLVETYTETARPGHPLLHGLVDGLHRCYVARDLGLSKVRAIVVSNVHYPLVPLPASWAEVVACSDKPDVKRHYRLRTEQDFPYACFFTTVPVTSDNVQYFFFRDLSALGSKGRRTFDEYSDERAT